MSPPLDELVEVAMEKKTWASMLRLLLLRGAKLYLKKIMDLTIHAALSPERLRGYFAQIVNSDVFISGITVLRKHAVLYYGVILVHFTSFCLILHTLYSSTRLRKH